MTKKVLTSLVLGSGPLALNATRGFLYITSSEGAPTGVPETHAGGIPLHFDSVTERLYFYSDSWKSMGEGSGGGVSSFNTRTGAISLTSEDVTGALGFTPYNATNPALYINRSTTFTNLLAGTVPASGGGNNKYLSAAGTWLGIDSLTPLQSGKNGNVLRTDGTNVYWSATTVTSQDITTALGFTPYDAANPSSYIARSALFTNLLAGTVPASGGGNNKYLSGGGTWLGIDSLTPLQAGKAGYTLRTDGTNVYWSESPFTSQDVTNALGFTPYNATNPSNYISRSAQFTSTEAGTVPASGGGTAKYLSGAGTWLGADSLLPAQTGKNGQVLRTNGTTADWSAAEISDTDITTALGYTPYDAANPSNYVGRSSTFTSSLGGTVPASGGSAASILNGAGAWSGINTFMPTQTSNAGKFLTTDGFSIAWQGLSSGNVTTALGYTPYNATNPDGFITRNATYTNSLPGTVPASDGNTRTVLTGGRTWVGIDSILPVQTNQSGKFLQSDGSTSSWQNLTASNITAALNYTPYNATNPAEYITRDSLFNGNLAGTVPNPGSGFGTRALRADGTWVVPGTVSSVGLTAASSKIAITGTSPITASGAFTVDVNEANLALNNIGGTLSVAKGGTGATTLTAAITALLPDQAGKAGQYLSSTGTFAAWTALSGNGSALTELNGEQITFGRIPLARLAAGSPSNIAWLRGDGTWSAIADLAVGVITSGVFASARLGTGTADNTSYLRGDGTWQVPPSAALTSTQIAFGSAGNAVSSSPYFAYTTATRILTIGGPDGNRGGTIQSATATSGSPAAGTPDLTLKAGNGLGSVSHSGNLILSCGSATGVNEGTIQFRTGILGTFYERARFDAAGNFLMTSGTGLGYGTGSGGTVTQATSRTTGVTLNKPAGQVTLFSAAGTATWTSFTVTNSTVTNVDIVKVAVRSASNKYLAFVTAVNNGSFEITFATTGGTGVDAPVINFAVIKGAAA